ncbi:MAG: TetR family transcriptional regulator [Sphingobium sp.]|nr:MAG: TetR family transcriptional regulator [Sphingobium sp.]
MTTALQHGTKAHRQVVAAARHLFAARGFHQTAMADLAEEAGVSVGAIYRSFKGKADIITAIFAEDTRDRLEDIGPLPSRISAGLISVEDAIGMMVRKSLDGKDEALSFEILAEAHRNPEVARTITGMCNEFRTVFREITRMANPALDAIDLDAAEELLLACLFGLGHRLLSEPRLSVDETVRLATRMILAALCAQPVTEAPARS